MTTAIVRAQLHESGCKHTRDYLAVRVARARAELTGLIEQLATAEEAYEAARRETERAEMPGVQIRSVA